MMSQQLLTRHEAIRQAEKLHEAGLMSSARKDQLIEQIRAQTDAPVLRRFFDGVAGITAPHWNGFDFVHYCNSALIFDLAKYPPEPEKYYEMIFDSLKKILPGFDYTHFSIRTGKTKDWNDWLSYGNCVISFMIKNKTYRFRFEHDQSSRKAVISREFHAGINKWLADLDSLQRLYFINRQREDGSPDRQVFGVILMTQAQATAWTTNEQGYLLWEERHDNRFNTGELLRVMAEMEQLGLFVHYSEKDRTAAMENVSEADIDSFLFLLLLLPKLTVCIDWETENLHNPYEALTLAFAKASRGAFNPSRIRDTFSKNRNTTTVQYGFECNGKIYETELRRKDAYLDAVFFDLVRQAVNDSASDSDLYVCERIEGVTTTYLFLSPAQYKYLQVKAPELEIQQL